MRRKWYSYDACLLERFERRVALLEDAAKYFAIVLAESRRGTRLLSAMRRQAKRSARHPDRSEHGIVDRLEVIARAGLLPVEHFGNARNGHERNRAALAFAVKPATLARQKKWLYDRKQRIVVDHPVKRSVKARIGSEFAPLHQIAESFELLVGHAMQSRVSVLALERHDQKRTDCETFARAAAERAGVLKSDGLVAHRGDGGLEHRAVDMLAPAEPEVARPERLHRADRSVKCAHILRERSRRRQRFAIRLADRKSPSAACEQDQVVQAAIALRPVLSGIRDRNDPQAWE